MNCTSPIFNEGETIPSKYTCDGLNIPPTLIFSDVPKNAKSLALIFEDLDAAIGIFTHWIVWNIPPTVKKIADGEKITYPQGKNSAMKNSYVGPCPPSGKHRYFFKIFALDTMLDLKSGADKKSLEKMMQGHIIDQAQLMGLYSR